MKPCQLSSHVIRNVVHPCCISLCRRPSLQASLHSAAERSDASIEHRFATQRCKDVGWVRQCGEVRLGSVVRKLSRTWSSPPRPHFWRWGGPCFFLSMDSFNPWTMFYDDWFNGSGRIPRLSRSPRSYYPGKVRTSRTVSCGRICLYHMSHSFSREVSKLRSGRPLPACREAILRLSLRARPRVVLVRLSVASADAGV